MTAHIRAYLVRYIAHNIANARWESQRPKTAPQTRDDRDATAKGMMLSTCLVGSTTSRQALDGREPQKEETPAIADKTFEDGFFPFHIHT